MLLSPVIVLAATPWFTPVAWMSFVLLAIGLLVHITLVNIVLGMSVIVPVTEYLAYRRKDESLEFVARRLFRYLAVADLVAGVFGTWVAVELTAFWPKLLYIFSTILFVPVMIAIVGIVITIPSVAIYWYGWDRMPKRLHLGVGAVMAIGALMVPGGFRMLFAFIDYPNTFNLSGLSSSTCCGSSSLLSMFTNPIYVVLTLHSWFGGLTMAALFAAGAFAWSLWRRQQKFGILDKLSSSGSATSSAELIGGQQHHPQQQELPLDRREEGERIKQDYLGTRFMLKMGLVFLIIQSAIGVIYYFDLSRYAPYVFAAITGNTSIAALNFEIVFVPFLLLVALIWMSAWILYAQMRRGVEHGFSRAVAFLLMFSTFVALPFGEASNDAARAPYIILSGTTGLPSNDLVNYAIPLNWSIAYLAVAFAILVIAMFLITIYFTFVRSRPKIVRFPDEVVEENRKKK